MPDISAGWWGVTMGYPSRLGNLNISLPSPRRQFFVLLGVIFFIDLALMLILGVLFHDLTRLHVYLFDSLALVILCAPFLWGRIVRPMRETAATATNRIESLLEYLADGIISFDEEGAVRLVNPAIERMFGFSAEEVIGRSVDELLVGNENGGSYFPFALAARDEWSSGRVTYSITGLRCDGSRFPAELSVSKVRIGNHWTFLGLVRDVTARKRDEQDLLLLKRAIESSVNGISITDVTHPDNPIIYVNPAFERMTGYAAHEVLGKNPRFLRGDSRDQEETRKMSAAFRERRDGYFVLRNYRKDGTLFWNELYIAPVRDRAGVVTNYIGVMNDITEHRHYEEQLIYHATHDPLTGLPNRNLLQDRLAQALALDAFAHKNPLCVMFLDLDNFKKVNDTLGHTVGDMLLKAVADRLTGCVRGGDTVARLGGDEYIIVLPNVREMQDVITVAKKIIAVFAAPFPLLGDEIYVTSSIGIALSPTDGETVDALLKNADAAMYHAKEQGKNNYQFYSAEMNIRVFERLALETSLHRAIRQREFLLHYQPRVDLRTGRISGVEALVRWNHPEIGLVSPAKFIPLAEETGLIVPLGEWVLRTACAQNRIWQERGLPPLRIAVNLSSRQFRQENLIQMVAGVLTETHLAAQWLELELTESLVMQEGERSVAILTELKEMGIDIAIDDFGTGYSSLSYLKRFPVRNLKIDQSFIRDMTRDPDDATLVRTIITMAHGLGMKVIAEGVELEEQLDFLRRHQCEEIQGYYFSQPLDAEKFEQLLRSGKSLVDTGFASPEVGYGDGPGVAGRGAIQG